MKSQTLRPKERFLAALRRQPVDCVPVFDFLFQRPLFQEVIGRTPETLNARDAMDLTVALGLDAVALPFGCFSGWTPRRLSESVYQDEWGTTFEQNPASWPIDAPIAYPLKTRADLATYVPPDPWADGRLDDIQVALAMNAQLGDRAVCVLGGVGGPFALAWMLVGYEQLSLALYDDPEFISQLAQLNEAFATVAIRRMAEAGVDAIIISEDLGSSSGGLLAPDHFRQFFKPTLAALVAEAHRHGRPVLFHSCGRIYDYLNDLLEIGIDALNPLQRTAGMDLARMKREYGHRLCLVGNIDSSRTLPYGTPDQVEAEVREAIAIAAPGGGYILSSDHSLHDGIPVRNILRMIAAARKYGSMAA